MRALGPIVVAATVIAGCTSPDVVVTPSASGAPSPLASPTRVAAPSGLAAPVPARAIPRRRWFTLPDGLGAAANPTIDAEFDADVSADTPIARLRPSGREAPFASSTGPNLRSATVDVRGLAPGIYAVDVIEHLRSGAEAVVATTSIVLSEPVYVVWTLDFEGDAATDTALANAAAIADGLGVPMTIMWNPRVWTTDQVGAERDAAMLAWTKARAARGDEVGLHIHAWTDFVRAAGVTPRTAPSWSGRGDGYDVPLTAFTEDETGRLLDHALRLVADHGLPRPTTFRAGGLFASAANLRAIAAAGFTADTSAAPAGLFGGLQLPWTLAKDAQPYHPSRDDANASGDLPLLEVPNIAGNTYGHTATSIQRTIRDDLAMLPRAGEPAAARRALTLVSHPATIDDAERAAIETLFRAFEPYRYDKDAGPLRFVTMSQLVAAYR